GSDHAIWIEVRDRPRSVGGGAPRRRDIPLDHERLEPLRARVVAGVQGAASDREAVRAAQDGFRGGACVPEGGEPESPTTARGRGMRKAPRGGRLREVAPLGGVAVNQTEAPPNRSAQATPISLSECRGY